MRRKSTARTKLIRGLLTLVVLIGVYGVAYTHGTASCPKAAWAIEVIHEVEGAILVPVPTLVPDRSLHRWARENALPGYQLWGVLEIDRQPFVVYHPATDQAEAD